MVSPNDAPPIVCFTIFKHDDEPLGMRIKQGVDSAVIVYHVDPGTAAADCVLADSPCHEILSVNDHKVRSPADCVEMLKRYTEKNGKVEIVASAAERGGGFSYVMAKNTSKKQRFRGSGLEIDGLKLSELPGGGGIKVTQAATSGFFSSAKVNKGDIILSIDGKKIFSVEDARTSLLRSSRNYVPILTFNLFRRLKTSVMSDSVRVVKSAVSLMKKPESTEQKKIHECYDVGDKLGEGAFAVVRKGQHKETNKVYAIKIVNRSSLGKAMEVALEDEIFILKELEHENVMGLHEVFVSINYYYLVTEYLDGGELFDRIVGKDSYTETEARRVCKILFTALVYIHSKKIAHRDLKPENLLLQYKESDSELKIADFGFSKLSPTEDTLSTVCGTPGYVAPEILSRKRYGTQSDMWSAGVIVFILLGGYPPFYGDTEKEMFTATLSGDWEFDEESWGHISQGPKDLIDRLLTQDPQKRLTATDALNHPWMTAKRNTLSDQSLFKSQVGIKRYQGKKKLKAAMRAVMFVGKMNDGGIFSGRDKKNSINDGL